MDALQTAFFSYAREDRVVVQAFVTFLSAANVHVLWDGAIEPGQLWEDVLLDWLEEADMAYAFWSERASNSEWVDLELDLLASQSKSLVPVMLDDTPLPASLSVRQGIQLGGMLKKWTRVGAAGAVPFNIEPRDMGLALREVLSGNDADTVLNRVDAFRLGEVLIKAGQDDSTDTVHAIVGRYGREG